MTRKKLLLAAVLGAFVLGYFVFDLGRFLSLEFIKNSQAQLVRLHDERGLMVLLVYFVSYVLMAALSLPGAAIMTLAGGAIFGLLKGVVVVSFASSVGATLAFLVSRHLLRDSVQSRFGARLKEVNAGIEREGAFYLFALRLVPLVPFFVINLVMGLTRMKTGLFYLVSQVGMLAATVVYVNAGTQLAKVDSARDILSPGLIVSFVLLGFFPLIAKKVVDGIAKRRVYARWAAKKPKRFDRNLVVIGAGAAGLVTSYVAAAVKAKVTLVEAHKMGGDCLNYGCVPSKALIKSASLVRQVKNSQAYGIAHAEASFTMADVMERVARVVRQIEPHDSIERYVGLGVEVLQGHARIVNPWTVEIDQGEGKVQSISTRNIVIAAGSSPVIPALPGLADVGYLTTETLWGMRELPARLIVLGGGPIGCEMAQCFARLNVRVVQIELEPRLLLREDDEVSALAKAALEADGVQVLTGHRALRCEIEGDRKFILVEANNVEQRIEFDQLLCAVGRTARLSGYGLEQLGIPTGRVVLTNEYLETIYPNIFAAGDVAGPYQFTHVAAHQAGYAAVNALFGRFKKFKADYSVIPCTTFIDPEIARVGLNEQEAHDKGIAYEVTRYGLEDLDRAIADSAAQGFVKVLTVPGKDTILGVTIMASHAGDLLAEYVLAMRHGLGLNKIFSTIHTYPTMSEANKYVAGEWKRRHHPNWLLKWLERFHDWQRG